MSEAQPIVIESDYVESATREAQAWITRRNTHWAFQPYMVINCGLIGIGLATIGLLLANSGGPVLKFALVWLVIGMWLLAGRMARSAQFRLVKTNAEAPGTAPCVYRFSEDGISEGSAQSEIRHDWAAVKAIWRGKHGLFVHCGPLAHCVARDPQNPDDLSRRQAQEAVMALWAQKGPNAAAGKGAHG